MFDLFGQIILLLGVDISMLQGFIFGCFFALNALLIATGIYLASRYSSLNKSQKELSTRIASITDQTWEQLCQLQINDTHVRKLNKELHRRNMEVCELKNTNCHLQKEMQALKQQMHINQNLREEIHNLKEDINICVKRAFHSATVRLELVEMLQEVLCVVLKNCEDHDESEDNPPSTILRSMKENPEFRAVFEKYTVDNVLGGGGFGQVWAAQRIENNLLVAIKFATPKPEKVMYNMSNKEMQVMPWEVGLMQLVSFPEHPGVIKLLEWFTVPTKDVLVLELVEASMNLTDYMKIQGGHLTEDLTKNILSQVVQAVQHIHSCLVFHRDLKPGNILIQTTTGKIKLIDFGCGTMLKKGKYQSFEGTTLYAPPEVFSLEYHEAIPTTSWSLGVTLFELLCGQLPFQKVGEILCGRFIFTQDLSDECQDLIERCLSMNPEGRPTLEEILLHPWMK
ncbi:serine/threonine-protein kinase pim-2-like [Polypterus senegalus]|uniref:serine/threonine-protein kinase pim-2-like n=1 Tax=Polypterus senegalus TaxID=55291 RepID=UPI001962B9AF|nr:serine/threonine-protein kinase pim-2-like [Polypterus senegalus]